MRITICAATEMEIIRLDEPDFSWCSSGGTTVSHPYNRIHLPSSWLPFSNLRYSIFFRSYLLCILLMPFYSFVLTYFHVSLNIFYYSHVAFGCHIIISYICFVCLRLRYTGKHPVTLLFVTLFLTDWLYGSMNGKWCH